MKRSTFLMALVAGLLGCAAPDQMRSEVTRFNQLPATGGSALLVAADPRKSSDPMFRLYARRASDRLQGAGFKLAAGGEPDYVVQLDYWQQPVEGGHDDSSPRLSLGIGGASFGGHSTVGMGVGTSFSLDGRNRDPLALRMVSVVIERRADGSRVFEGRAQSVGPAGNFAGAVPYMIDAIFTGFPGENGKTITVNAVVEPAR
ncbi:hypothetical protein [Emcibacter sp. SYSU 3D8]|uniref:hypothetical protein n=1 Tax=Emcibacter sp. SYSU 3D8 TaxID=3133969 RepID=UPI0031FE9757